MPHRYDFVLWDFDGTLADSLGHALRVYNRLADTHGFKPVVDPEQVRGMAAHQFLKLHGIPAWKIPSLFRRFLTEITDQLDQIPIHPGIIDCVTELAAAGVRQAIVSSNVETNIRTWLSYHNIEGHFESVVGYKRLFGKEKPIRRQVQAAGFDSQQVIYVGDEVRDIEAGRKAGIDVAAVTWGLNSSSLLQRSGPTLLVAEPRELLRACLSE